MIENISSFEGLLNLNSLKRISVLFFYVIIFVHHLQHMKPIILIVSLFLAHHIQAQKLYVFSQRIVPGTRQATMDKDGNVKQEKRKELWKYPLYLEIPAGKKIVITEVWLNGERYTFDTAIVKGPIHAETGLSVPGQVEKILIPATNNQILNIMPREKLNITTKDKRKITGQKKVVVCYTKNGKPGYRSSDKIQELPDMLMQ